MDFQRKGGRENKHAAPVGRAGGWSALVRGQCSSEVHGHRYPVSPVLIPCSAAWAQVEGELPVKGLCWEDTQEEGGARVTPGMDHEV